jgi:hypothetical protein
MKWLRIYSDKNIEVWEERLFHAKYTLGLTHEDSKKFLTVKYGITEDEYDGICDLVDEKEMNKIINAEEI